MNTKIKVYLATNYTHYGNWFMKRLIQWWRYKRVSRVTAHWVEKGYNVFSPITHSHPLTKYIPSRLDTHTMWLQIDFEWIDVCDELWVYMQDGWEKSYGVKKEIEYAIKNNKTVRYINKDFTFH